MASRRFAPALVLWLFPVVTVGLIVGVIVAVVSASNAYFGGSGIFPLLRILAIPLAIALFFGIRAAVSHKSKPAGGVELPAHEHPALWAEVNQLAALAQTAPPSRIVMVPEVNASVSEASGRRELELGLPLLATLTRGQLRAVLAHELGHFAGGDTAASARIVRRLVLLEQVREKSGVMWRWFFSLYARLYALAAGPAAREAELRADQLSVAAAGARTSTEAMRAIVRADLTWQVVTENYLSLFELAGRRAPVREAMHRFMAANAEALEPAIDRMLAAEKQRASDTHPPLRERIAHFQQAAQAGAVEPVPAPEASTPACDLLAGGGAWLDAAEGELAIQQWPLASWDEVIVRGMRQQVDAEAEQISARARSQGVGDGGLQSLLTLIERPAEGLSPDAVQAALFAPVLSAMLAVGAARVLPSWSGAARFTGPDGSDLDIDDRIASAAQTRDSGQLRAWLTSLGVDVAHARATTDVPQWMAAGSHLTGPWDGRRDVHFWTTGLLALPPLDKETVKQNKEQFADKHQYPRLYRARAEGIDAVRRHTETLWWDAASITNADVTGKVKPRITITLADGTSLTMTGTLETVLVDSPGAVAQALGYLAAPRAR
ncbi:M48 family metallopeptidase [Micropruina sp.]|uniref:M48 family metallopeptidase n=1 Tax=Micropruina sp. TaxID=2737536 RepID=UPI0039E588D6